MILRGLDSSTCRSKTIVMHRYRSCLWINLERIRRRRRVSSKEDTATRTSTPRRSGRGRASGTGWTTSSRHYGTNWSSGRMLRKTVRRRSDFRTWSDATSRPHLRSTLPRTPHRPHWTNAHISTAQTATFWTINNLKSIVSHCKPDDRLPHPIEFWKFSTLRLL